MTVLNNILVIQNTERENW